MPWDCPFNPNRNNIAIYMPSYFNHFTEFQNANPRILLCSISAALLHDIGRCFGGDGFDIFGATSAYISGVILSEVGFFSDEEIEWIKEAIEIGGLSQEDVENFSMEKCKFLNEKQLIASLMGDADSYEFERYGRCDISYTSVKKLGIMTKDGQSSDEILNALKKRARKLVKRISEPMKRNKLVSSKCDYVEFLRNELTRLNANSQE